MSNLIDYWELGKEFYILDGKQWINVECTLREVLSRDIDNIQELKEEFYFYNDTEIKAITIRDEKAGIYNNCQSCNLNVMFKEK